MVRSTMIRIGAVVGVLSTTLVLGTAPAGAAPNPPPGWTAPPTGWVAFTLDDTAPAPVGRTGFYTPVTLERHTDISDPALLEAAFSNWDYFDFDGNPSTDPTAGWPATFSSGGITLQRVAPCPLDATACEYNVVSGAGNDVFFFAGLVPDDPPGSGTPAFDLNDYYQGALVLAPSPQVVAAIDPNLSPVPGSGGTAGKVTLNAAGFTHDELPGTTLTYEWIVKNVNTGKFFGATGETTDLTLDQDGTYCIQLKVTASDGATDETPACGEFGAATFQAIGFAPAAPTPTPTPGSGGGSTSGGGIVFGKPIRRAPAAAASAPVVSAPTVVWLWRPDWFTPTEDEGFSPKTTEQVDLEGRRDIVVNATTPSGASAVPWLAGVGLFGLLGAVWIVRRRRMVRLPVEY